MPTSSAPHIGFARIGAVIALATLARAAQDFPIVNTAQQELSISAAFDGTNFLVGIQGDAAGSDNVGAQRVSPAGALVGGFIPTGRSGGAPFVAYGGGQSLLVWEDDALSPNDDIWGMFISTAGVAGAPFAIDASPIEQDLQGGVASDGSSFLVAYSVGSTTPPHRSMKARLVSSSGAVGSEIAVSSGKGAHGFDCVAYGGGQYLVVWTEDTFDVEVRGRFISAAGVPGTEFSINTNASVQDGGTGVEFDGTNFLVTWTREVGGVGTNGWDVHAQRVSPAGALLGAPIVVNTSLGAQVASFVAFDGTRYLVTWTEQINDVDGDSVCDGNEGTCTDVSGQWISTAGALVGPAFSIARNGGDQSISPVAVGAGRALVVYADGDWLAGGTSDLRGTFVDAALVQPPAAYCTSKVNTLGCTPLLTWSGTPRVGNPAPFTIQALNVRNQKSGLCFYGTNGGAGSPFQGGTMCLVPPVRRTVIQGSGGSPAGNDCSGQFSFDFNAYIASGADAALTVGAAVRAQYWSRDPGSPPVNTNLSNALGFVIAP